MRLRLELKGVILGEKWGLDEYTGRPSTRRERAPGDAQGNIILCDSVLNRIHNFVQVCPNYSLDEICLYSKYLKAMTITRNCSIIFAKKWL